VPLLQAFPAARSRGVLGNKNGVSFQRGLSAIVSRLGGGQALAHKVFGMSPQQLHAAILGIGHILFT
jgi:hypothetical protein